MYIFSISYSHSRHGFEADLYPHEFVDLSTATLMLIITTVNRALMCAQCVCEWGDRDALFTRLDGEVRRELAAGRVPPVQPFHAMAYPFSAELALAISMK